MEMPDGRCLHVVSRNGIGVGWHVFKRKSRFFSPAAVEEPSRSALPTLAIHLASIADLDHEYAQHLVLYLAHNAKVAGTITPQATQRSRQCFAGAPWICRVCDAFAREKS